MSQNHYAFGAVGEFLHRCVAGVDTGRGLVSAGWNNRNGELVVDATIAPGCTATINVGDVSTGVGPGTHRVAGAP